VQNNKEELLEFCATATAKQLMFLVAPCFILFFYKGNVALRQVIIKKTAKTEVGITQN